MAAIKNALGTASSRSIERRLPVFSNGAGLETSEGPVAGGGGGEGGTPTAGSVTNTMLAAMAAGRIKGRITSSGAPQDLTAAQVRTLLSINNVENIAPQDMPVSQPQLDALAQRAPLEHSHTAAQIFSAVAAILQQGSNVTLNVNPVNSTITLSATGGTGGGGGEAPAANPPVAIAQSTTLSIASHADRYIFTESFDPIVLTFPAAMVAGLTDGMEFYGVNLGRAAISFVYEEGVEVNGSAMLPETIAQYEAFSFVVRAGALYRTS